MVGKEKSTFISVGQRVHFTYIAMGSVLTWMTWSQRFIADRLFLHCLVLHLLLTKLHCFSGMP